MSRLTKEEKALLAKLGAKGGHAGTGKAKIRGNRKYYQDLAKKRWGKL